MREAARPSIRDGINNTKLRALFIEVVNEDGERTKLVFPLFDKDKALAALMSFANAPDMNFVSIAKRLP